MKKAKVECDFPEELRCKRSDSKSWRCSKRRAEDSIYCEHHRDILRANNKRNNKRISERKMTRKNGSQEEIVIGITKQCLSNNYNIKEPEIAETVVLPKDLSGLENLKDVLTMEAWRDHLTPTERRDLLSLLPEGQNNDTVVELLLSGENFNFGNPALMWGASVCKGEQFPSALLKRERELKLSQSQFFKDRITYRDTFLGVVQELKQLCESFDHNDKLFRNEMMPWMAKRYQRKK